MNYFCTGIIIIIIYEETVEITMLLSAVRKNSLFSRIHLLIDNMLFGLWSSCCIMTFALPIV